MLAQRPLSENQHIGVGQRRVIIQHPDLNRCARTAAIFVIVERTGRCVVDHSISRKVALGGIGSSIKRGRSNSPYCAQPREYGLRQADAIAGCREVSDMIHARQLIEHKGVSTCIPCEGIITGTTRQAIVAASTDEAVIPEATNQCIIASSTGQRVSQC